MDDPKPDQSSDKGLEAPNVLEVRTGKHPSHNKETHGMRDDIDVNTPIGDVKGPNVFERVKEEFEAIKEAIHSHKESPSSARKVDTAFSGSKHEKQGSFAEEHMGSPSKSSHHKETHGRGDDIDADIPISEFKGPSIFHRAKEEIEAIVDTIHSKKESDDQDTPSPKKEGGFRAAVKQKLHRISKHE
uniref:uncharacterized protein LOC122592588 n=1 Tax=Erigeron canadensis TaxID=72917 RepID=UPI001CB91682|nr:uncharacterized protein LOC122592588 [Erigeron canadensis]XP_043620791.1 uncharacterized protein LOC122592588 [Erigeron canadensis]XP_043620792.1 uncharacterized protein LOC122592588 [Erigeron canadensis]XP_043620793.1 uncharacterized protein LOC122592588 [Erigeron canadensis]